MSGEVNDRSVRWAVALTVAFMAGGYMGSVGAAQAGDEPSGNAGPPGRDGRSVTCSSYWSPRDNTPVICDVVGEDGEDGAPGAVYR